MKNKEKSLRKAFWLLLESSKRIVASEGQTSHHYLLHNWEELTFSFLNYFVDSIVNVPRGRWFFSAKNFGDYLKQLHEDGCFTPGEAVKGAIA